MKKTISLTLDDMSLTAKEIADCINGKIFTTDQYAKINSSIKDIVNKLEKIEIKTNPGYILLKFGHFKSWKFDKKDTKLIALMQKYLDQENVGGGIMADKETAAGKKILCEIIDEFNGIIQNDWDGNYYTKEEAKAYVLEYGE